MATAVTSLLPAALLEGSSSYCSIETSPNLSGEMAERSNWAVLELSPLLAGVDGTT